MTQASEQLDKIADKQAEAARLLNVLRFYDWLVVHGTKYDQIKGQRKTETNPTLWRKIPKEHRPTTRPRAMRSWRHHKTYVLELKLKDDSELVLPYPPFDDDVVFGRSVT